MLKYLLRATVVVIAFCAGVTCNSVVNGLGGFLIDRYDTVNKLAIATLSSEPKLESYHFSQCGQLIVTVTFDGNLYLNKKLRGNLDNPGELLDRLRSIFEIRGQMHVYRAGVEATSAIREEDRIEKTVYIKVARTIEFAEVVDLIDELKQAGANPIVFMRADCFI